MRSRIDPRTPVLVGVGTTLADREAVELMVDAAEAAGADCGSVALLRRADRIVVPRGTWSYTDPARIVAGRVGAERAATWLVDLGIPQQTLIDDAMAAITSGHADVVLVVGAEGKARAARATRRAVAADASGIAEVLQRSAPDEGAAAEVDQRGAVPDVHRVPTGEIVAPAEVAARLWAPVEQYALIESALRASEGIGIAAHRRQVAELGARFNAVARTNPEAAFPAPMDADSLGSFGPHNRPLAFPYGKWQASQWTVDQGAALLLCAAEVAESHGVAPDLWVFPRVGVESSFALSLTRRHDVHRWPAMAVLGRAAAERVGRPLSEVDHAEIYSCFPSAVRVQQRELDLALDGTPTITGGMTFAGGPFNSYEIQATAAMARRLREQPGLGLVTTVSGMLTKPGLAVWASEPDGRPPLVADLGVEAAAATETVDVLLDHDGPASVCAVTATYDGMDATEVIAVLDTAGGDRVIARCADRELAERATTDELVGETFTVRGGVLLA